MPFGVGNHEVISSHHKLLWVVLGVGPGKTTRLVETLSPVDSILAECGAKYVNINLLRCFSEPATLDNAAKTFLQRGMTSGDGVGDPRTGGPACQPDPR